MLTFLLGVFIGAAGVAIVMFTPKWPVGVIMEPLDVWLVILAIVVGVTLFCGVCCMSQ